MSLNDSYQEEVVDEIAITGHDDLEEETTTEAGSRRVICHQCGSLFSDTNPECSEFDEADPRQQGVCGPGEACLWYSWQKTEE